MHRAATRAAALLLISTLVAAGCVGPSEAPADAASFEDDEAPAAAIVPARQVEPARSDAREVGGGKPREEEAGALLRLVLA
ncbi:MAG TPA: hypothetical protein VM582_06555, partial [Candidatus Thermoplasmatota archaeon]|nr:hypothetical protein [Candidatus Thermoplasmatota archaeon]